MNYNEQLLTEEWATLRKKVLDRDNHCCLQCKNKIYLDEPNLNFGFIKSKASKFQFLKLLSINTFKSEETICKISNELNNELLEPSVIYFKINEENWINIVACRYLTNLENSKYLEEPKAISRRYLQEKIKKEGITDENFSSLAYFKSYGEVTKFRAETLKVNEDWHSFKWHFTKGLHVHHNYYQIGKFAWEYPIEALSTLCWSCHEELHESTTIEVRDKNGNILEYRTACYRCHGAGWFPEYKHVENGICFRCRGTKFEETAVE